MELLIPIVSVEGCIGRGSDGAIFWSETVIDILALELILSQNIIKLQTTDNQV